MARPTTPLELADLQQPGLVEAGADAAILYVWASAWSDMELEDGFVSESALAACPWQQSGAVDELRVRGLWTSEPGGYRISEWKGRVRAEVEAARKRDRQRKKRTNGTAVRAEVQPETKPRAAAAQVTYSWNPENSAILDDMKRRAAASAGEPEQNDDDDFQSEEPGKPAQADVENMTLAEREQLFTRNLQKRAEKIAWASAEHTIRKYGGDDEMVERLRAVHEGALGLVAPTEPGKKKKVQTVW